MKRPHNPAIYAGRRTEKGVFVEVGEGARPRPLNPRLDLGNHSPAGFDWGYGGSGPAQLALALLADATGADAQAVHLHRAFKWAVTARIPQDLAAWTLTAEDVLAWVDREAERDATAARILGALQPLDEAEVLS